MFNINGQKQLKKSKTVKYTNIYVWYTQWEKYNRNTSLRSYFHTLIDSLFKKTTTTKKQTQSTVNTYTIIQCLFTPSSPPPPPPTHTPPPPSSHPPPPTHTPYIPAVLRLRILRCLAFYFE